MTPETLEGNKAIAIFMGRELEECYYVGNGESICFSADSLKQYYPTARLQKEACNKWLNEMNEKYPDGWVAKGGYSVMMEEYAPFYNTDWNLLKSVVDKINNIGKSDTALEYPTREEQVLKNRKAHVTHLRITESIATVWDKCVVFAKWYNNQNKKQ